MSAELHGNRQVHRRGVTVELCRVVLPLLHRVESSLVEKWRTGDHLQLGDVAVGIDERVQRDVAGDTLRSRHLRIDRRNGLDELRGLNVTPNRDGDGRRFLMSNRVERVSAGIRSRSIDRRERLAGSVAFTRTTNNRGSEAHFAE